MKLTKLEEKLFRERVIREYKSELEKKIIVNKKPSKIDVFWKRMKALTPVNLVVGIIAAGLIVIIKDWETLAYLMLYGIVWLTLITTVVSALFDQK